MALIEKLSVNSLRETSLYYMTVHLRFVIWLFTTLMLIKYELHRTELATYSSSTTCQYGKCYLVDLLFLNSV